MNFLEANKTLKGFVSKNKKSLTLGMSGTSDQLLLYIRAYAVLDNIDAILTTISFGTLSQTLFQKAKQNEVEFFVFFPWDFVPELDWRTGIPETVPSLEVLFDQAKLIARQLQKRENAKIIYIPSPVLPIFSNQNNSDLLSNFILGLARELGAKILSSDNFTLGGYLSTGNPIRGDRLSAIAEDIWELVTDDNEGTYKVLVTDLDGVMWSGIIGEDGFGGIEFEPNGKGFSHFLYQGLLRRLKSSGIILAAVTRNNFETAILPFDSKLLILTQDDFVSIIASYEAKSAQIQLLSNRLNIGLESFVFVDDNPVELAEVSTALPEVTCLKFPKADDEFLNFAVNISKIFSREIITNEDIERSNMYQRQLKSLPPSEGEGANITEFLQGLEMKLTIHDRSKDSWQRTLQLINKTNQFNLNGRRVSEEELTRKLKAGARLYSGSLSDRTGDHGEVIACLVEGDNIISSFIMSCRVFQRQLEYAFIILLFEKLNTDLRFDFEETKKNNAIVHFFQDQKDQAISSGMIDLDRRVYSEQYRDAYDIFEINNDSSDVENVNLKQIDHTLN